MRIIAELGVIMMLIAAGAAATWALRGAPERSLSCDPKTIKRDEICLLDVRKKEGVVWIDARPRARWEKDGLSGSVMWNLDPAEDAAAMEADVALRLMDASIAVVYCDDEACGTSRQIAERVSALGLVPEVRVLFGGWQALADAGLVKDSN